MHWVTRIIFLFLLVVSNKRKFNDGVKRELGNALNYSWSKEERDHYFVERIHWMILSITGVASVVTTTAAAIFAFGAYDEAKHQANVAQQALDASTRPWVLIDKVVAQGPLIINDDTATLLINATVKNYAQLPAIGSFFIVKLFQVAPGLSQPRVETKTFCDQSKPKFLYKPVIISPSNTQETQESTAVAKIDRNKYFGYPSGSGFFMRFKLHACYNYVGLDGKDHQTASRYTVMDIKNVGLFDVKAGGSLFQDVEFIQEETFSND